MFKHFEKNEFLDMLRESRLEDILYDTNLAVNLLSNKITTILDILAPIRTIQVRASYVSGISEQTKNLQRERKFAQEKAAFTNDPEDWRTFRSLRNQATASVRMDKKRWEEQRFDSLKNSTTDIWRSLKGWLGWNSGGPPTQLFHNGRLITRPVGLSSTMNEFFITKIKNLREKIPQTSCDPLIYLRQAMKGRSCTFSFKEVSLTEVKKVICSLKNSSATGVDYIDTKTIKLGVDILAPVIQHIINLSMCTSTFPDSWKWHKMVPLLKSADCDKSLPKSYRPVALLPVLSKVLERVVFNQLVKYLEENRLIHPNLHGSRAGHSTGTALTQLYDTWVDEVEKGKMVGVLLCDQSAAFDLCDHYLLIEKLKLMGLDSDATAWFLSYLSDRRQSCMVDGHLSASLDIPSCGVPQGSIGGPILWLIFTCDQPDAIHDHEVDSTKNDRGCSSIVAKSSKNGKNLNCGLLVGYVDDGAYSFAARDPQVLSNIMTEKFDRLAGWMTANKLVNNPDKTHLMVMGRQCDKTKRQEVFMIASEHIIFPSESEKLLGAHLHQSLDWKMHIRDHRSALLNQLSSRMNGLKKLCKNASFNTRLLVANGVVMSKLTYLIILWGGAQQYLLNALQVQQLVAARLVCGFGCLRWSKRKLLDKVGWLSIRQLVFYHSVLQAKKTLSTGVPVPLHNSLSTAYPRPIRSATSGQIRQNPEFTSQSTFRYRAMVFYNSVPSDVRSGSLVSVKRKLKRWIKSNIPID